MDAPAHPETPPPPRTLFVTALAWAMIALGALLSPISLISAMMIAVGSYGTKTSDPLGFLIVVVLPPASFIAGIALLRRRAWARLYAMALMLGLLAWNAAEVIRGPTPEIVTVSPTGTRTTISATEPMYSIPVVCIALVVFAMLLTPRVRAEFR